MQAIRWMLTALCLFPVWALAADPLAPKVVIPDPVTPNMLIDKRLADDPAVQAEKLKQDKARDARRDHLMKLDNRPGADVIMPLDPALLDPALAPSPSTTSSTPSTVTHTLQLVFPLDSLVDWVQAKGRLGNVAAVKGYRELQITNSFVKLELTHTGEVPELAAELQKNGLSLFQQDNDWILKQVQ